MLGTMILIIAFIMEAAFATCCIITRSNQSRIRGFVRIGALAAFVLFTLVSVIQWGFRWYLLAALLVIWAALGTWALLRKTAQKKAYRPWGSLFGAIGTLLLVFICLIPALVFPQYKQPPITGTHPVESVQFTYTDTSRTETFSKTGGNREVIVEFWYPTDTAAGTTYPLVVFSHGTGGMKGSNRSTFMDLASNGYVVCSIDHPYHSMYTVDAAGRTFTIDQAYLKEYLTVSRGQYDDATELKLEHGWMQLRVADIKFVLDTILQKTKETGSGAVYQLIDPAKIGLMGHSLGGESVAQVARERVASGQNDIKAVINLDADLAGEYTGIQDGKPVINSTPYPVPILNIFTDALWVPMEKVQNASEVIAVKHVIATAPNAYQVHLAGTNHLSVTDMALISPFLVSMINSAVPSSGNVQVDPYGTVVKLNGMVLQFFNVYLKGEGSFMAGGSD